MVQAEPKYKLFRRIFNKKVKTKAGIEQTESHGTCSEDEIERAKVRKIQLGLKAKRNHEIQYEKLKNQPNPRYPEIVTHTIFGLLLTLTFAASIDLIYALFIFDRNPSDPLDVFRSVICDDDGCTVRSSFDVEPRSIFGILIWLVFGLWSLYVSVRNFFCTNERGLVVHVFSAFLLGLTIIIKREQWYTLAREPL